MFFTIAAAALVAFLPVSRATPLSTVATRVKPVGDAVTIAANFPVHELSGATFTAGQSNITHPSSSAAHSDVADATFPATLFLCPTLNCASCFTVDLSTVPVDECLQDDSSSFQSVAISQPSNEGLPFAVLVGPPGCGSFAQIPEVNACFNINGGPFTDFAIVD